MTILQIYFDIYSLLIRCTHLLDIKNNFKSKKDIDIQFIYSMNERR